MCQSLKCHSCQHVCAARAATDFSHGCRLMLQHLPEKRPCSQARLTASHASPRNASLQLSGALCWCAVATAGFNQNSMQAAALNAACCAQSHAQVMAQVRSGSALTRALFERAYAHKKACLLQGDPVGGRWGRFYDALVFSKIRARLGGEVKTMTSGACGCA